MAEKLVIHPGGEVVAIHSDRIQPLMEQLGQQITIRRASHVEVTADLSLESANRLISQRGATFAGTWRNPDFNNKFWADLHPSGGPVLGPFDTYQAAIEAEVAWINAHGLTACQ